MTATENIPILILGGGAAGLAAALELARRGTPSLVVEKGPRLGGQAANFCCKAAEACARCGACRLGDLLGEAALRPEITFLSRAMAVAARRQGRGWEVDLAPQAGEDGGDPLAKPLAAKTTVACGGVILAVGHAPFNPQAKSRFGFGRVPGVITASELERKLSRDEFPDARRLAFIQCVGSRDQSLGALYCSRVCCGFALRMARLIKYHSPDCEITFFHMDVQGYGRAWEDELADLRRGLRFVRAMPGEIAAGPGGPEAAYADPDGSPQREEFDLVVLSQGLTPPPAAGALAEMFGLERTADGFLGREQGLCSTGAEGVFAAGAARGPRSIVESIDHAAAAAAAAWAHLHAGAGEVGHG